MAIITEGITEMKQYFIKLSNIGKEAITALRIMDARHITRHSEYLQQRLEGDITEHGFNSLTATLEEERKRAIESYNAEIDALQKEYNAATDTYMTPSTGRMHMDDIELLRTFKLSAPEFESMAKKYADNPTMGRLLEEHRKEHNIHTNWRLQSGEARKEIFNNARFGVESLIRQLDKYNPARENSVDKTISLAYNKLQGADTKALPAVNENTPAADSGNASSFAVFNSSGGNTANKSSTFVF